MNLNEAIAQAMREEEARKARERQEEARQAEEKQRHYFTRLEEHFQQALAGTPLRDMAWTRWYSPTTGDGAFLLPDEETGKVYAISPAYYTPDAPEWSIYRADPDFANPWAYRVVERVSSKDLAHTLLLKIGEYRADRAAYLESERLKEKENARKAALAEKIRQEDEQKAAEQKARVQAEHEKYTAILAEKVALAKDGMWQWPRGYTLVLWKVTYQVGAAFNEYADEYLFDYREGYTLQEGLGENGTIALLTQTGDKVLKFPRQVPVLPPFEMVEVRSAAELPPYLQEEITVSLANVYRRRSRSEMDYDPFLDPDESDTLLAYDETGTEEWRWVEEVVGVVPVAHLRNWIGVDNATRR